ncbi:MULTISPECIES: hypothetical protein [Eubacteriales]|uniref:Na+/glutamate symporter n=1 Tax=Bittarella massiliensis (ex Durand et al. 2017) TaxID=1720313 RepID=A0AAQ1MEH3_9FIRM|nr:MULTISPECIES: hypothetical protein [Eubacteriales]ERI99029.1 hypothetical protein HMPREF0262_02270 [Clostridium sp. ATCC 29733]MZL70376.1 hypothetical protein [Bittarella massiliensis (ex Durand et al. 2017)]MZL81643.1 hypothetical protein [Bittarella massiliensis (ex Durand et al. 2017)]SHG31652.1 Na+/glutamate symporter [Bittarella massiliensis (ex Durand et al. 2017)]
MTFTPILAFAVVAIVFALGDLVARKTKGIISAFIVAIVLFVLFGGVLKVLPADLMDTSGLNAIIPTFGMGLILTNLGSTLDLNELKKEWRTILVALAAVIGILVLGFTLGQLIFGRELALSALPPVSGGVVATIITSDAATAAGRPDVASYVAAVNALQVIIGLPISSFCLKKAATKYASEGNLKRAAEEGGRRIDLHFLPKTPKGLDSPFAHFARLALVAGLAELAASATGLNATIVYLLFGALASATGVVDKNALAKAGGDGVILLATYAYCSVSFLTMSFSQFASILVPVFGMLLISALGITVFSMVVGKLFKWSPALSIAAGFSCMFGYPITYTVAMEVVQGVTDGGDYTEQEVQRLTDYVLPKMLIAGVTTVSVASVVLAGVVAPMIFA